MKSLLLKLLLITTISIGVAAPFFGIAQQEKKMDVLQKISAEYHKKELADRAKMLLLTKKYSWQSSQKNKNKIAILTGIDVYGFPIYTTINNNTLSAATTHTNKLWQGGTTGFNLSGSSPNMNGKLAIWDEGLPSINHTELIGRIVNKDGASVANHSTHVAGTLIAKGINPVAKGMVYNANILNCYDFNDDISEIAGAASGLLISNHSYGRVAGWQKNGGNWQFNGNPNDTADYKFGFYDDVTQMLDSIAFNAAYYTIVKSVGNNRNNNGPAVGQLYMRYDNTGTMVDAGIRPAGISSNDGYDIIPTYGVAKNIITVGAVEGIASGSTKSTDIKMSNLSSWGPTDDGRIKPDIVANGVEVLSTSNSSNAGYEVMTGTSMATPNVAGSLFLLQELYSQKYNGNFMKAATLKALAIHTATEAGNAPGPDYKFGWGLLNVEKAANVIKFGNASTDKISEEILNNNDTIKYYVTATGNGKLMATICWTDPVGSVSTTNLLNNPALKLVNNLDIRIIQKNKVYMPWVLDPANPSLAATTGDNFRDNVERVEVADFIAGQQYIILITHKGNLQRSSQAFSLILSGVNLGGSVICNSNTVNNGDVRIDNFTFAGINNTSTICNNYDSTTLIAKVEPSKTYPVNIFLSSCNGTNTNKIAKLYIDYNCNGNFVDANELVYTSNIINGNGNINTNITIPNNIIVGNRALMRLIIVETNDSVTFSACNSLIKNGATQDYQIQFINPKKDIAITDIAVPAYNICASNSQYVSIRLVNSGDSAVSNIPLKTIVKNGAITIATLNDTYQPILESGASIIYTFQTPFTSLANTTYTITATANLLSDQIETNNSQTSNINTASVNTLVAGQANICGKTATLKAFNTNDNQNYNWYNAANINMPIAIGTSTTSKIVAPIYYVNSGNAATIGAATKSIFTDGDYQLKGGNYFKYTATVPMLLENAKLYTAYPGKVTITVANIKATFADGTYTYNSLNSITIDVAASKPIPQKGNVAGNDVTDTGLVYNINLLLPSGSHAIIVTTDSIANIFRNKNILSNPYPYSISNLFTITGNNATNPEQFYYYLYNMNLKTLDCQTDKVAVIPTIAAPATISKVGDSLICSSSINYQWQKDSVDVLGETNQTYKPIIAGNYSCVATDNTGCKQISNYIITSKPAEKEFSFYPNPANNVVNIKFVDATITNTVIQITDVLGRQCIKQIFYNLSGNIVKQINTAQLSNGIYVLNVIQGNKIYKEKLLVQKHP